MSRNAGRIYLWQGDLEPYAHEVGWDDDDDIVAVEQVSDGAVVVHEVDPGATGGVG